MTDNSYMSRDPDLRADSKIDWQARALKAEAERDSLIKAIKTLNPCLTNDDIKELCQPKLQ